ncbi:hypothetical protein M409DRAFT_70681 [Zasmidium cellare ATCC 36951]|uniref:NADP-dependent oxidoreductase domain-containing protein n=1 Tax=Zasmidium cellare ATCC 36951 TaxID=1080233 RepID=A0A6A6BZD6_ZASCE|nr:uncharacterized protein M409DRAFT_70681 [Zasmidium cellare ATCC 36951]KAF2160174.1 hypothetical protein M409DRAFT_70681 [Zasmidium cellare ATCC 36951]
MTSKSNGSHKKPRVILGTMILGPYPSTGARITSLETYNSILDYFQSQGYNKIDTARVYVGRQQETFTRAWYPYDASADRTNSAGAHKAEVLEDMLNKSLSELGADCVDIFYLHRADRSIPFQEPLRKLDGLHKQGKFIQLGLSNYSAFELAEIVMLCKANGWIQPTIFQCMYNAITRSIEPELVAACRRYGLDIVVYNPIAGGLFSGKYKLDAIPSEGRYSDVDKEVGGMYRDRYFKDSTFDALRVVQDAATKHDLTLLEIAFRWLTNHSALNIKDGGNDGVVIGVSSQAQLEQNLRNLEKGPLPQDLVDALNRAWMICKATAASYVHGELKYEYDTEEALAQLK